MNGKPCLAAEDRNEHHVVYCTAVAPLLLFLLFLLLLLLLLLTQDDRLAVSGSPSSTAIPTARGNQVRPSWRSVIASCGYPYSLFRYPVLK